jgi:hypothetical protein
MEFDDPTLIQQTRQPPAKLYHDGFHWHSSRCGCVFFGEPEITESFSIRFLSRKKNGFGPKSSTTLRRNYFTANSVCLWRRRVAGANMFFCRAEG